MNRVYLILEDDGTWLVRQSVGYHSKMPKNARNRHFDPTTGFTHIWLPVMSTSWKRLFLAAVNPKAKYDPGTYELRGPRVNENPDKIRYHIITKHEGEL